MAGFTVCAPWLRYSLKKWGRSLAYRSAEASQSTGVVSVMDGIIKSSAI